VTRDRDNEKREAARFWDAVIKAKGGRDRLYHINNFLVSDFRLEKDDKVYGKIGEIHLFVFPNKSWLWSYAGPYPSPAMALYAGDPSGRYYSINPLRTGLVTGGNPQGYMDERIIMWLLDTRSLHTEPMRVTRQRQDKQLVDVIETNFEGGRFDFTVDIESLMVLRISQYGPMSEHETKPWLEYVFKDYTSVDGIQMPRYRAVFDEGKIGTWYSLQFSFNVEYDPHLFNALPPISAGPDAWKPRPKGP
jgi:hypothetical protein